MLFVICWALRGSVCAVVCAGESAAKEIHWSSVGSAVDLIQELCSVMNIRYRELPGGVRVFTVLQEQIPIQIFIVCQTIAGVMQKM